MKRESAYSEVVTGGQFSDAEREFLMAMERYMRLKRRPFPTWHEVLQVVHALGYRKQPAGGRGLDPAARPDSE